MRQGNTFEESTPFETHCCLDRWACCHLTVRVINEPRKYTHGEIMTYTGGKKYLQGSPMPFGTQVGDVVDCFWGRINYILRTSGDKGSSTAIRMDKGNEFLEDWRKHLKSKNGSESFRRSGKSEFGTHPVSMICV